ncbi:TonB-dependent receptor [Glacieibacterium megasporae]|uniref:TonB-dependent receptor n=1 Tax=Glacieibacterium megasporae TaxID=2835787 RepID=UPI001C1E5640|nr:TonB-dependent receptor [Polymorphobacter megasporae]UAJ10057.1 TonB-dependent receptor [Polymorphobacter megasporae]
MRSIAVASRTVLVSGVSLLALFNAGAGLAQSAASAPANPGQTATAPTSSGGYNAIDEIVVTAQRTSQSLQDVPIAVTAFTAQSLAAQQINNSSDLQLTLPNITFTKGNFTTGVFTIRGVGDLCVGVTCDSATAIHVNDLPLFNTRIFETDYFDLERVEVLRGPQGTLYGRNATAGVVNFITVKPDLKALHASVEGEYGNYNDIRIKGMINVPLTDTLGVRFAGTYLKRDGYTQNLYNNTGIDGRDEYALRGSVRWRPEPNTTIDLMGYYFHENDSRLRNQKQQCLRDPTGVLGCLPGGLTTASGQNGVTNANATIASLFVSQQFLGSPAIFGALAPALKPLAIANLYGPDAYGAAINPQDPRQVYTAYQPSYFSDEINATIKIEHDFGKVKLDVSGLYQRNSVDSSQDYDLALNSGTLAAQGLTVASIYGAGGAGALSPALAPFAAALSQIKPALSALIPNGVGGPYCTSTPFDTTGTGAFGGHSVCGAVPLNADRSVQRDEGYTGEAILTTQFDGKLNFLFGGIYNSFKTSENSYYVNAFGLDYGSAVLGLANTIGRQLAGQTTFPSSYEASPYYRNNTNYYKLTSYGLFGEAYLQATDRLKLTVGLRYNNDQKTVSARTTLFSDSAGTAVLVPYGSSNITQAFNYGNLDYDAVNAGNQLFQTAKVGFSEVTGRAVLDYKITDQNLLYASYSRGYKSGGINPPLSPGAGVPVAFSPEFIDSFEIGSKNTFLDGTVRLNLAAFYYKYKNLQISRIVQRTAVNDNINADIYGVEADAIIEPIRAFAVNLGFSYLKTKVVGDSFFANPRDPSGGRGDAVIIKDITTAANCAVVPKVAGNAAGAQGYVTAINSGIGLNGPTPFPTGSGIQGNTTGAFGICSALAANAATVGTLFGGVNVANDGVQVNVRGNQLPQSPKFKASAGAQYTIDLGTGGINVVPRFDIALTGESTGSIFNDNADRIPSYYIMNAQVQVNGKDDRWFVRGFIQNIANNNATTGLYVTDQSSGLFTNIFTLEPRRYGIAGGIKF